jgi:hypothetical protein
MTITSLATLATLALPETIQLEKLSEHLTLSILDTWRTKHQEKWSKVMIQLANKFFTFEELVDFALSKRNGDGKGLDLSVLGIRIKM